jgi:hypothetical protein
MTDPTTQTETGLKELGEALDRGMYEILSGKRPNLQPHQERVIAERDELRERIIKLTTFINTQAFLDIQYAEQRRLIRQQGLMQELRDVLDERIAAFKPAKVAP